MNPDPNANSTEDCPPDLPEAPPDAIVRSLDIINQRGLHARASAKFVQTVEKFDADVRVTRCGETVGGTSIMGLMMLAAGPGTSITVTASGAESGRGDGGAGSAGGRTVRRGRLSVMDRCRKPPFLPDNDIKISLYLCCGSFVALL